MGTFGFGSSSDAYGDDDGIDDWMAQRNAGLAARQVAEQVGRDLWEQGTRSGENVAAPNPDDLARLGAQALADGIGQPSAAPSDSGQVIPIQPLEADGPFIAPPSLRFATARPGDSISKLVGTSNPAAIGRFLSLNGMDPRQSTIYAGQSYAIPTSFDDASGDEIAAGAHMLRQDNARLALARAPGDTDASNDAWQQRFETGLNVWTGEPVHTTNTLSPQPSGAPSQTGNWLDKSVAAKRLLGSAAGMAGQGYGVIRGGVHTVEGAIDGAHFMLELPFSATEQAEVDALGHRIGEYVSSRADQPNLLGQDLDNWIHQKNLELNPYATPMAGTLSGEWERRFDIGSNQGEAAFNIGSLLFGGEVAKGLEAAAVAREAPAVEAYVRANLPADEAEYMLQPYKGMGAHYAPRRTRLPEALGGGPLPDFFMNSRFNVSKLEGANRWQQYKHHFQNDLSYSGGPVPGRTGPGSGWSGRRYGWQRNDGLTRLIEGMPADTKGLIGGVGAAELNAGYDALNQDQPQ